MVSSISMVLFMFSSPGLLFYSKVNGLELSPLVAEAWTKTNFIIDVVSVEEKIWQHFGQLQRRLDSSSMYDLNTEEGRYRYLTEKLDDLSKDLNDFKYELLGKIDEGVTVIKLLESFEQILSYSREIDVYANVFARILVGNNSFPNSTIEMWARAVAGSEGVDNKLHIISSILLTTPLGHSNILENVIICSTRRSMQQYILYFLYQILSKEIRCYIMVTCANELISEIESDEEKTPIGDFFRRHFHIRMNRFFEAAKMILRGSSRILWRCDPVYPQAGITYDRFGPFFQGHLIHQIEIPGQLSHWRHGCKSNCDSIEDKAVNQKCRTNFCIKQRNRRCSGRIRACKNFDEEVTVCPSTDQYRRYEYIKSLTYHYGHSNVCDREEWFAKPRDTNKKDCRYCLCTCEDYNESKDRNINLRPVMSDLNDNKVITGIRLTKKNNIIHIQIKQGILEDGYEIRPMTNKWKPIEDYSISDVNTSPCDYVRLSHEQRSIHFDDLDSPNNNTVVTGIKFLRIRNHLKLSVYITPIDFNTGKLLVDQSTWLQSPKINKYKRIYVGSRDVPINYRGHKPSTSLNSNLNLTTTGLKEDVRQNVVPFLDVQPVVTNPPMPLSGASLIYKEMENSGGYIALKVFTFDFEECFREKYPSYGIKTFGSE